MNQPKLIQRAMMFGGIYVVLLQTFLIGNHVNAADTSLSPEAPAAQTSPSHTASVAPASSPAEKDGLSIVIQPVEATVNPDMNLAIRITYANNSKAPFRFPSGGSGVSSILFALEDVNTGTLYTGGDDMFENGAPRIRHLMRGSHKINPTDPLLDGPAASLHPGETRTVTFQADSDMGFYRGKWDDFAGYSAARDSLAKGPPGKPRLDGGYVFQFLPSNIRLAPPNIPFPPGTYKLTATIEFPIGDQPGADADPAPLWKGLSIRSNPVEVKITGIPADIVPIAPAVGAAEKTGWISGTVLDPLGKPAANVALTCYAVTDLAKRPEAMLAGTTDGQGHFTIKDLPPGRYMVIAGDWISSGRQPVANGHPTADGCSNPSK